MKKDFAFLFYVNDWAGGTQWFTRLQRGGYLDLLLYQVNNTSFSLDKAKEILGQDFDNVWKSISDKFVCEDGLFFNEKMKEVLELRRNFTESRRKNRVGKRKKTSVKHKLNTCLTSVKQVGKEKEKEKEKEEYIKEEETKEEKEHAIQKFIEINCQRVATLKKQMTFKEAERIEELYGYELAKNTLLQMENFKPLTSKYTSVTLTLNNWCKNGKKNDLQSEVVKYPGNFFNK